MPVVIVTGASRGLGLALSRSLAERGWRLIVDARGAAELDRAAGELQRLGDVIAVPGDVGDDWHRQALALLTSRSIRWPASIASALGPSPQPSLARYRLAELERVYAVNVLAPLALFQAVLPRLVAGARILNITSDAAVEPSPGLGGYGSSKAALEQLTAILAAEHPDLRIHAVDPGDMRTQLHQEAFPGEDISDRPPPEDSVSGLLALIGSDQPSGRHRAQDLGPVRA